MKDPNASELVDRTKTEARRLVSLLHQQTGISLERVRSTVDRLVELTSLLGVNDYRHGKARSEGSYPSEDPADQAMPSTSERIARREPESEETSQEDPERSPLEDENVEWLDDEAWSG